MSSKKKKRHASYLAREAKRIVKKEADIKRIESMESGDIEEMAKAMGIKLKEQITIK